MRKRHKTRYPGREPGVHKRKNVLGYVLVYHPEHPMADVNGEVYEHRLVMAEKLGRLLEPGEVVHHVNGVRDDNHPDNLMSFALHSDHRIFETGGRCKKGHPYTPSNTVTRYSRGRPFRQCVTCERRNGREKARRRAERRRRVAA